MTQQQLAETIKEKRRLAAEGKKNTARYGQLSNAIALTFLRMGWHRG